jgi:hypothetical protein
MTSTKGSATRMVARQVRGCSAPLCESEPSTSEAESALVMK